jgi:hypothetical protein
MEGPPLEAHPSLPHPVRSGKHDGGARSLLDQLGQLLGLVQQLVVVDRQREQIAARLGRDVGP